MQLSSVSHETDKLRLLAHHTGCGECGEAATLRCGRCKLAMYCCDVHQRAAYNTHRLVCAEIGANDDHNQADAFASTSIGDSVDETKRSLLGHFYALIAQVGDLLKHVLWQALIGLPMRALESAVQLVIKIGTTSLVGARSYLCKLAALLPDLLSSIKTMIYRSTNDATPSGEMTPAERIPWSTLVTNSRDAARMDRLTAEADACARFFDTSVGTGLLELMRQIAILLITPLTTLMDYAGKAVTFGVQSVVAGVEWAYSTAVQSGRRVQGIVADLMPVLVFASELPANVIIMLSSDIASAREATTDAIAAVMPPLRRFWRQYVNIGPATVPDDLAIQFSKQRKLEWDELIIMGIDRFRNKMNAAIGWIIEATTSPPVWALRQLMDMLTPVKAWFVAGIVQSLGDRLIRKGKLSAAGFTHESVVDTANAGMQLLIVPEFSDWIKAQPVDSEPNRLQREAWDAYERMMGLINQGKKARLKKRQEQGIIANSNELIKVTWDLSQATARFMRGEELNDLEQTRIERLGDRFRELRTGHDRDMAAQTDAAAKATVTAASRVLLAFVDETTTELQSKPIKADGNDDDLPPPPKRPTPPRGYYRRITDWITPSAEIPPDIRVAYAKLNDVRNLEFSSEELLAAIAEEAKVRGGKLIGVITGMVLVGAWHTGSAWRKLNKFNVVDALISAAKSSKDYLINAGRTLVVNQVAVELRQIYDTIKKYEAERDAVLAKYDKQATSTDVDLPWRHGRTTQRRKEEELRAASTKASKSLASNNLRLALAVKYVFGDNIKRPDLELPAKLQIAERIELSPDGTSVTPKSVLDVANDPAFEEFFSSTRWRQAMDRPSREAIANMIGDDFVVKDIYEDVMQERLASRPELAEQFKREWDLFAYGRTHEHSLTVNEGETILDARNRFLESDDYKTVRSKDSALENNPATALVVKESTTTGNAYTAVVPANQKGGKLQYYGTTNTIIHTWPTTVVTRTINGIKKWREFVDENYLANVGAQASRVWSDITYGATAEQVFTTSLEKPTGLNKFADLGPPNPGFYNPIAWVLYQYQQAMEAVASAIGDTAVKVITWMKESHIGVFVANNVRIAATALSIVWWTTVIWLIFDIVAIIYLRFRKRRSTLWHEDLAKYSDNAFLIGKVVAFAGIIQASSGLQAVILDVGLPVAALAVLTGSLALMSAYVLLPMFRISFRLLTGR